MLKNSISNFIIATIFAIFVMPIPAHADERIYIYKDDGYSSNKGIWGNIMPAAAAEVGSASFNSASPKGFDGKGTAVKVSFNLSTPPNWAGVVVPVQADYWGETDAKGLDLTKAKKLVFYAKGEKGGEQIQVKAAIVSDKKFGDSAIVPIVSPWYTLEKNWKRYEITIEDAKGNLQRVITPFSVISNKPHNINVDTIDFYVDEIYYEQ